MYHNDFFQEKDQASSFMATQKELEDWFQSAIGRSLLANQRQRLGKLVERCYGFHQAEIGVSHRIPVGNASGLGHGFYVVPRAEPDMPENTVVSLSTELALDHDCADMVILHHALDFSADPHQTLREAARILKPSGQLALVGFNPLSLWGVLKLCNRSSRGLWRNRFISGHRVSDWLNLLDFNVDTMRYYFYAPPINHPSTASRFGWIESILNSKVPLGAYYVIMAQKQQGARINLRRSWRKPAKVIGIPVAGRASRTILDDHSDS
jgi:SAM-dependent methyltransferase